MPAVAAESDRVVGEGLVLRRDERGLALIADGMELRQDFRDLMHRVRPGVLERELIVRAARVRVSKEKGPLTVVDATAGLGEDAFLLAAAGFEVILCEADPVIAALLADALRRAADDPATAGIASRMVLRQGDSVEVLRALPFEPDVVYLDPMFPARRKSAAVKKKFQLLHRLERPCDDEAAERLLTAALAARARRIVIKRPAKGPCLAGARPSHAVAGKAVRFDVIVPPRRIAGKEGLA